HDLEAFKAWKFEINPPVLLHGPMLGNVTDSSASFWVRTDGLAEITIRLDSGKAATGRTTAEKNFTTVVTIDNLEPSTVYEYEVLANGKLQKIEGASLETFPGAGGTGKFAVGFGGGAGYIPEWERMWDTIGKFNPVAMLMLGDNVYIDQPEHPMTNYYCYMRRQSRPEWRRLVAGTAMYSIWDDHDFGTNDCVPGPEVENPKWKRQVWNIFRENWVNPAYGGGEKQPGCWYDFAIGDVHFIFLDGRYYRDLKGGTMLGPVQKKWLLETLKKSEGTFKVIASPVPFTEGIKKGSRDPWDGYPEEREEIFSFIESEKIEGVFLVAADRHRTDLRVTKRPNGYDLYEFESSRLTNRHTHSVVQTEGLLWGYKDQCSFGLMRFDTTAKDPQVKFEGINIDGEIVGEFVLKRSMLNFP
ncbi:MAG: alkaline phosphatase family protein, partial [Verrucomicrobiales bacterium]|nr:alkaline phosphatase family protein [Verrucomicrobiales bacterium]